MWSKSIEVLLIDRVWRAGAEWFDPPATPAAAVTRLEREKRNGCRVGSPPQDGRPPYRRPSTGSCCGPWACRRCGQVRWPGGVSYLETRIWRSGDGGLGLVGRPNVTLAPRLAARVTNDPTTGRNVTLAPRLAARVTNDPTTGRNVTLAPRLAARVTNHPTTGRNVTLAPRRAARVTFSAPVLVDAHPKVRVAGPRPGPRPSPTTRPTTQPHDPAPRPSPTTPAHVVSSDDGGAWRDFARAARPRTLSIPLPRHRPYAAAAPPPPTPIAAPPLLPPPPPCRGRSPAPDADRRTAAQPLPPAPPLCRGRSPRRRYPLGRGHSRRRKRQEVKRPGLQRHVQALAGQFVAVACESCVAELVGELPLLAA